VCECQMEATTCLNLCVFNRVFIVVCSLQTQRQSNPSFVSLVRDLIEYLYDVFVHLQKPEVVEEFQIVHSKVFDKL